jgi:hypothetical protein
MRRMLAMLISVLLVFFLLAACPAPQESTTPPETHTTGQPPGGPGGGEEDELPGCPEQPEGYADPNIAVDIYEPERAYNGTTLIPLNYDAQNRRIIEVNMLGEIVWEYLIPENGFVDAELLSNNNVLYTVGGHGVYEIDRDGNIVWSYLTSRVDHDADRLPNGNTIFVCASDFEKSDAQVTEVNSQGQVVWQWYARDYFDKPPYSDIISGEGDWTHTNAVSRLTNGNTLISLRNFDLIAEVDPQGAVVRIIGEGVLLQVHDPEMLPNGNILAASQDQPEQRAKEVDPETDEVVWQSLGFTLESHPVRDTNRLPNGNTLITASNRIVEVTAENEIVWQLILQDVTFIPPSGFYKADRICRSD